MTRQLFLSRCGVVAPIGHEPATVAEALFSGKAAFVERDDLIPGRPVRVGAVSGALPAPPPSLALYDCRNSRLMAAALAQIADAVEVAAQAYGRHRIAVILGTSTSGIAEGEAALAEHQRSGRWPPSFHYRQQEPGNLGDFAARLLGLSGPAYTVATACSSSAKVFASARRLIRSGVVDAALIGGADTLCRMTLNGFGSLEALSKSVCNPFSANRDGITIGEGAAAFLLGPDPGPVALLGVGESSDAHHPTAPEPDGRGAYQAMAAALADAGLSPEQIGYINLHGTATPLNDAMESKAVAGLFGSCVPCSSTKGMTGHMLGATGGVEAAFLWLTLNRQTNPARLLPPHSWDGVADPSLPPLALVTPGTRFSPTATAMLSNSFGFGGSNVSLVLGAAA